MQPTSSYHLQSLYPTINMMMQKIQRFCRMRQIHTMISQETIKPYSPTPQHLKTHNLSLPDQYAPFVHQPKVLFYKNFNNEDTNKLKKSLSKCLTNYYPFAGRLPSPTSSHIECNDEGIEFLEASNDSTIDDHILNKDQDDAFDELLPNYNSGKISPNSLLNVQLNHFAGGGAAVAVSISHKISDGFTTANFINHWANVTRGEATRNPVFSSSNEGTERVKPPEVSLYKVIDKASYIARRFVFPNFKLKELKKKVSAMGAIPNPTRVEVLTALLYKCAVDATTANSGYFTPSDLIHTVNMRNNIFKNYPERAAGNVMTMVTAKIASSGDEIMMNEVIGELRKEKTELEEVKDMQALSKHFEATLLNFGADQTRSYVVTSSLCRLPFYDVDFGWGRPIRVGTRYPDMDDRGIILLDTPSGDGIEALVHLKKEEMAIFEMDKEFLSYVEDK